MGGTPLPHLGLKYLDAMMYMVSFRQSLQSKWVIDKVLQLNELWLKLEWVPSFYLGSFSSPNTILKDWAELLRQRSEEFWLL